jgi:hypothetical protein
MCFGVTAEGTVEIEFIIGVVIIVGEEEWGRLFALLGNSGSIFPVCLVLETWVDFLWPAAFSLWPGF